MIISYVVTLVVSVLLISSSDAFADSCRSRLTPVCHKSETMYIQNLTDTNYVA